MSENTSETNKPITEPVCLINGSYGIYVPNYFYESFDFEYYGLNKAGYTTLSSVDNEFYWDNWDELLSKAKTSNNEYLYQDSDLFLIPSNWDCEKWQLEENED